MAHVPVEQRRPGRDPDGAADLSARLAARNWDLDDPARAAELESLPDLDIVRVVIRPDSVRRFAG